MKYFFPKKILTQFIKYGLIGIINTLLTISIIWILTHWFNLSEYSANIIGYGVGITNSFIWNRKWTFSSKSKVSTAFLTFIIIFVFTYLLQLGALYLLLNNTTINAFACQIISMCVYTATNFPLNRHITFKK